MLRFSRPSEVETEDVNPFLAGLIAMIVAALLAFFTTFGVVNTVSAEPKQPEQNVMDYGTNQAE
ncbi:hypothetical protein GCM10011376_30290 [Nocardioides flavus (ex Wang et al. 2016)]|uniref:Uncharacterized protein n=1 Tax=Nocardioides flavus (ex Wang et al. 2016) TaxID=2058780 RepID=A0ABQ3HQJ9_9ACTN|nr:hypothetical protein GCM10011376_30290 [Nocardioides flavus (ex Wang et al. 2016)]